MKGIFHDMLECGACNFETERHDTICEGTPCGCESNLVLVLGAYAYLFVVGEAVHDGEDFMTDTCISNLIYKEYGVIIYETCPILITEVHAYTNGPLFLVN